MGQQLTILVLGEPSVSLDDQPIVHFAYDKVRALLYYLAVEAGQARQRAVVAELLWPDQPAGVARHSLRQALLSLRQTLGCDHEGQPHMIITRKTIQLDRRGQLRVDFDQFTRSVAAVKAHAHLEGQLCPTCVPRLQHAAELYRGDFLAHLTLANNIPFGDWVAAQSALLHQEALFVLHHLMAYHIQAPDRGQAQAYAMRLLELEPWDERAHRALMRLLALRGQRSVALQHYERCRRMLQQMFDMQPERETADLAQAIRSGALVPEPWEQAPAPAAAAPPSPEPARVTSLTRLPEPAMPLIGRKTELAEISARLRRPEVRLITICGPGGIGKSRLCLEVAQAFQPYAPDGVWFVPLAAVRHPSHVPSTIAHTLKVKSEPGKPIEASLISWLADKEALLVLDNFEHVVAAAAFIADLLKEASGLKLVITSRELLRLYGEWAFQLPPLSLPEPHHQLDSQELMHAEAVQLFISRARAASTPIMLTPETAPQVAEICRKLDGLPLAIELAAARAKLMSLPRLLARLNRRLDVLVDGPRNLPERHQTLRNTIDWSYRLLTEQEQEIFARLAVFDGSWTMTAASAIAAPAPGGEERWDSDEQAELMMLRNIESLLGKSMIRHYHLQQDEMRFCMLETLREYALEQLHASGEREEARRKHAEHYLALAVQARGQLFGADGDAWLDRLELEIDNLRAAFQWFVERGATEQAIAFCGALWHFWRFRSYQGEGYRCAEQALALSPQLQTQPRAIVLHGAGWMAHDLGSYAQAMALFEQSLALYRQLDLPGGIAEALQGIGELAKWGRDYQRARECFAQSLEIYRRLGNLEGVAWALDHLGLLSFTEEHYAQAAELLAQSLSSFRAREQRWGMAVSLLHYGMVELYQQHFDQAQQLLQESCALFETIGNRLMLGWPLALLGRVALYSGSASARPQIEAALERFRQLGNQHEVANTLNCLGRALLYQDDYHGAIRTAHESLPLLSECYDPEWVALGHANIGWAMLALGQRADAYHHFAESLRIHRRYNRRRGIMECLEALATLLTTHLGRPQQGATLFAASDAAQQQSGIALWDSDRRLSAQARASLAQQLAAHELASAQTTGHGLTLDEASDYAISWAEAETASAR